MKKFFCCLLILLTSLNAHAETQAAADDANNIIRGTVCPAGSVLITIPADICRDKFGISTECSICAFCGDGILVTQPPLNEECDGTEFAPGFGGNDPNKSCSSTCKVQYCGDSKLNNSEECDGEEFTPAFDRYDNKTCSANCLAEYCGDGIKQSQPPLSEQCDGESDCQANCRKEGCGDGFIEAPETCDPFLQSGQPGYRADCRAAGTVAQCTYCGDNEIQPALEVCDGNNRGTVNDPDAVCKSDCTGFNPYCGDGIPGNTPGERCDDGNTVNNDDCTNACTVPVCGDGVVNQSPKVCTEGENCPDVMVQEECDDGNRIDTDACSNSCKTARCGDGIPGNTPGESCDDGNTVDTDDCSNTCQNTCKYYSIQAISTGNSISELNQKIIDTDNQNIPSCLLNKITAAFSACGGNFNEAGGTYSTTSNDVRNGGGTGLGICITTRIFDSGLQPPFYYTENGRAYNGEFAQYLAGGAAKIGMPYKMFMDKNCNIVDYSVKCKAGVAVPCKDTDLVADPDFNALNNQVCGTVEARNGMSPISLLWDEESSVNTEHALVSFPINPNEEGKLFSWKASSSTPLLVFDPAGSGKITNASQLFGNWTFGGKDSGAIRNVALNSNGNLEPWQDGYEALATLDQNHDGVLNGSELAGLSLWFDADRDGVSDTGEVKRLSEVGVTELYTKHDGKDLQTGDIYASIGFKRGNYTGRTVDWFASSYNSLEQAQVLMQRSAQASQQVQAKPESEKVEPVLKAGDSDSIRNAVAGVWTWSDPQTNGSGFLILEINDKLEVAGRSLSEIRFQQNADNINSQIASYFLNGNAQAKGSDIALNFKVTGEGSHYAQTEAVLDSTGVLKGKTTEHYGADKAAISYNWTAKKYQP